MRRISLTVITAILLSLVLLLTGCENPTVPHATAFIAGNHMNFHKVNFYTERIYDMMYDCAFTYGDCFVIVSDGNPYVSASYSIKAPQKAIDGNKRKQLAENSTNQMIAEADKANAITPETDILAAFDKACGLLHSTSSTVLNVHVCDSGISTTGVLNFAESNIIDTDPQTIVEQLSELHSIPSFDGIHVTWGGIGDVSTSNGQDRPTAEYKHKLMAIWEAIIVAGGGTVEFYDIALSEENNADLPFCSTVPIIQKTLTADSDIAPETVIPIGEDEVAFVKNKAEIKDREAAIAALSPIADILIADQSRGILLAGSTASVGEAESCKKLSLERAEACKEILCELGVSANQVHTLGIGRSECSLRAQDLDTNGNLTADAVKNRAVFLMDIESNTAKMLLEGC